MAGRTLNVEVIGASGLKDTELFGKSDPYVVVSIGKTERKSKPAKDQAESPAWNEIFSLPVVDTDTDLLVVVRNDDTLGKDEEMGRVVIPLSSIYGRSHSASTFPLELKGKPHGEIKMSLSFEGEGHQTHHDQESHGLAEKVQGLFVGEKKDHDHGEGHEVHHEGHHEEHGAGMKEKLDEKFEGLKEKKHRKKKEKKHRGSGDEGSSSSSSESEKDDKA